jgi:hypothetical protein
MFALLFILSLSQPLQEPIYVDAFEDIESCQKAASKQNNRIRDEILPANPALAAMMPAAVCFQPIKPNYI